MTLTFCSSERVSFKRVLLKWRDVADGMSSQWKHIEVWGQTATVPPAKAPQSWAVMEGKKRRSTCSSLSSDHAIPCSLSLRPLSTSPRSTVENAASPKPPLQPSKTPKIIIKKKKSHPALPPLFLPLVLILFLFLSMPNGSTQHDTQKLEQELSPCVASLYSLCLGFILFSHVHAWFCHHPVCLSDPLAGGGGGGGDVSTIPVGATESALLRSRAS